MRILNIYRALGLATMQQLTKYESPLVQREKERDHCERLKEELDNWLGKVKFKLNPNSQHWQMLCQIG